MIALSMSGGSSCTSPFSKGTMREYSVVQSWSSSRNIRALGCFPNRSMHSRFESGREKKKIRICNSSFFYPEEISASKSTGLRQTLTKDHIKQDRTGD